MKGLMTAVPGSASAAERRHAALGYTASGLSSQAERLLTEASVLTSVIAAVDQDR